MKKKKHFLKTERMILELLSNSKGGGLRFHDISSSLPRGMISDRLLKIYFSKMVQNRKISRKDGKYFKESRMRRDSDSHNQIVESVVFFDKNMRLTLNPQGMDTSVVIYPESSLDCIPGDTVRARILNRPGKRFLVGKVMEILKRDGMEILIRKEKRGTRSIPQLPLPLSFTNPKSITPEIWYKARIDGDILPDRYICTVDEAVDERHDVDMVALCQQYQLPTSFPSAVLSNSQEVPDSDIERVNLTDIVSFTIDGADAKDFDDAISIQKEEEGYRLFVHITDVAYYVRTNSPLDKEAYLRGTSVYFPRHVVPMLPPNISDDLCSLRPGEEKRTFTCEMFFSFQGKLLDATLYPSIIKSAKRFTYTEVQGILNGDESPFKQEIQVSEELMNKLRSLRQKNGSIDFDFPEVFIELGDKYEVHSLTRKDVLKSHQLIEEFMLIANDTIAHFCMDIKIPTVYRHQPPPEDKKILHLAELLRSVKVPFPPGDRRKPKTYQKLLKELPEELKDFLQPLILRSMQQAVYSASDSTHFGLAKDYYCHFTSPIRRYPDLIVHRQLHEFLRLNELSGKVKIFPIPSEKKYKLPALSEPTGIARHSSFTERRAVELEREYVQRKKVEFISRYIDKEFEAKIVGLTNNGVFLELKAYPVEGFLAFSRLKYNWAYDENTQTAFTKTRQRKIVKMGDICKILVAEVDTEKYRVDFAPSPNEKVLAGYTVFKLSQDIETEQE
jgi:ribonuclease R